MSTTEAAPGVASTTSEGLTTDDLLGVEMATDNVSNATRDYLLRKRFGISLDDYEAMLAAQGGVCALCGTAQPGGRWDRFHVDHCHDTGRVRGLLCHHCNIGLGRMGDSPEGLLRAYRYVLGPDKEAPSPSGSLAARLDGCPSCVTNSEVPFGAYQPPSGGLVALYKCTDCGHRWHTSWGQESAA